MLDATLLGAFLEDSGFVHQWVARECFAHLLINLVATGADGGADAREEIGWPRAEPFAHGGDGVRYHACGGAAPARMHEGERGVDGIVEEDRRAVAIGP